MKEDRNLAQEYQENVKRLRSKAELPEFVIRSQPGWGVVTATAINPMNKGKLAAVGPITVWRLESHTHYDSQPKAEAAADLLIALPHMAMTLAEEADRQSQRADFNLKQSRKFSDLLHLYGINPNTGEPDGDVSEAFAQELEARKKVRDEAPGDEEEFDNDYGRSGKPINPHNMNSSLPVYTQEQRRLEAEVAHTMRKEHLLYERSHGKMGTPMPQLPAEKEEPTEEDES